MVWTRLRTEFSEGVEDFRESVSDTYDAVVNGNDPTVDLDRRKAIVSAGSLLAGYEGLKRVDDGAGWVADQSPYEVDIRRKGEGPQNNNDSAGGGDATNDDPTTDEPEVTDEDTETFEYARSDLPFNSIADGLAYQSDQAIDAFDDEFVEAYFNRNEDADQVVEDAYLDVDDATAEEYLQASSSEREDIDVVLGFRNGNEGVQLSGSASAGMDEDFEEYMVGLTHLGRFEREVDNYVDEVEDMLN